jgi:hypothetical protein
MTSPEGRPMRVGSDIDDVLIETAPLCIEMYNEAHGTLVTLDNWYMTEYDPSPWGETTPDAVFEKVNIILGSDEFVGQAEPVRGAPRLMRRLGEVAELLDGITGRPPEIEEPTRRTVARHFPGMFDAVDFTRFISRNHTLQVISKVDVAKAKQMSHFFEDLPHHANDLVENGVRTGLFGFGNYPWSRPGIYFGQEREIHPDLVLLGDMDAAGEWIEDEILLFNSLAPDEIVPMSVGKKRY